MPDASRLALFVAAALALLAVPGPAVLYIVGQSVRHGRRAGLVSVAGIHAGTLVHLAAATLGLSALLVSSATAFSLVRYAGAAYLVYLGIRRLAGRDQPAGEAPEAVGARRLFVQGAVVNVLNPKTALFFFAFLPQFVDSRREAPTQVLVLGLLFMGMGLVSDGLWALGAGSVGGRLRGGRRFERIQRFVSGGVFLGLGALAAFGDSPRRG